MARVKQAAYALCISNRSYPASLEVRKVYRTVKDPEAERHGLIRVIDESGESYLYPQKYFVPIEIPEDARRCFRNGAARAAR